MWILGNGKITECIGKTSENHHLNENETIGVGNKFTYAETQIDKTEDTENDIEQKTLKGENFI